MEPCEGPAASSNFVCRGAYGLYADPMHKKLALFAALCALTSYAGGDKFGSFGTNKVCYTINGEGSNTVVLIHGWGGSKELWKAQVSDLERDFRVLTVDLPGFGQSDKPKTNYSMGFLAEGVNAVLVDAKIDKAVLVGFSMGAPVISAFYKKYPAKVAGLVAVDGSLRGFNIPANQLEQILAPYRTDKYQDAARRFFAAMFPNPGTEKMRDEATEVLLKTPAHVLLSSFEQMADGPSWEVRKIEKPLLLVNTTNPLWSPDYKAYVKKLQPESIYKEIQGTGHFVQLEKPQEVNTILRDFLISLRH